LGNSDLECAYPPEKHDFVQQHQKKCQGAANDSCEHTDFYQNNAGRRRSGARNRFSIVTVPSKCATDGDTCLDPSRTACLGKKEGDACDSYIESENKVGRGYLSSCDNEGWFDWLDPHSNFFENPISIVKKSGGNCWLTGSVGSSLTCRDNTVEAKHCENAYYFRVPDNYFNSFFFLSCSNRNTCLTSFWFFVLSASLWLRNLH